MNKKKLKKAIEEDKDLTKDEKDKMWEVVERLPDDVYSKAILALFFLAFLSIAGALGLALMGGESMVPDSLWAIAGVCVGGIAAVFTKE